VLYLERALIACSADGDLEKEQKSRLLDGFIVDASAIFAKRVKLDFESLKPLSRQKSFSHYCRSHRNVEANCLSVASSIYQQILIYERNLVPFFSHELGAAIPWPKKSDRSSRRPRCPCSGREGRNHFSGVLCPPFMPP
jgi:hypothetical protein